MPRLIRLLILFMALTLPVRTAISADTLQDSALTVGIVKNNPPYSFKETGNNVRGLCVDLAALMGKSMNREIRFVECPMAELRGRLEEGTVDVIFCGTMRDVEQNHFLAIPIGINLQRRIFVNHKCATVTCYKDLGSHVVVLLEGDTPTLPPLPENTTFVHKPTYLEALNMLESGAADVFIAPSQLTAHYLIQLHGLKNVRQVGLVVEEDQLAILTAASNRDLHHTLSVALDRIQRQNGLHLLREKWLGRDPTLPSALQRYGNWIGIVSLLLLVVVLLVAIWNWVLKQKVQRMTADLGRSERRYRVLFESSPDMIFLLTPEGCIRHANKRSRSAFNHDGTICLDINNLVTVDEKKRMRQFLLEVFENHYAKDEFYVALKDGHFLDLEIIATLVQDFEDGPLACCFARDVTERNRMEEDLLQSERLSMIGKMAAGVAHEVNNPLSIVLAHAEESLNENLGPEEQRKNLEAIVRNAQRAGQITKTLLSLAAPSNYCPAEVEMAEIIRESLAFLRPKLKLVTIREKLVAGQYVHADAFALQQVFINLLINALTALEDEPGTISVDLRGHRCNGDSTVQVTVCDTGRGIERSSLQSIFEPFYTSRKKGFGLGLFISRRIIEKHGGAIYAESELGKYTSVIVELPALPAPSPNSTTDGEHNA